MILNVKKLNIGLVLLISMIFLAIPTKAEKVTSAEHDFHNAKIGKVPPYKLSGLKAVSLNAGEMTPWKGILIREDLFRDYKGYEKLYQYMDGKEIHEKIPDSSFVGIGVEAKGITFALGIATGAVLAVAIASAVK